MTVALPATDGSRPGAGGRDKPSYGGPRVAGSSFAFDIEVLFVACKLGARIVELPVSTSYRGESTFSIRKHLPLFLQDIVQIRLNDLAGRYRA